MLSSHAAQVPLRVWQESVKLVRTGTRKHTLLGLAAAHLLFESLIEMEADGGAKLASSNSSTVSSAQQQLRQSGLLAQLPALLTSAAQSLEATTAAGAAVADEAAAREFAWLALRVCMGSYPVWEEAWHTGLCAACFAPSMQLIAQCNKHLTAALTPSSSSNGDGSSSSRQQQQQLRQILSANGVWSSAILHFIRVMALGTAEGWEPRLELLQGIDPPLPNNQHFLEVLAWRVAQLLLQPLVRKERARRQQQQQDGGSRGWQWELAVKLAPKVPQEVAAVLEHLDCSRELVLWQVLKQPMAAAKADNELWNLVACFTRLQIGADARLPGIGGPQQPQQLLMLQLLLSVALMRWTSSRPCVDASDVNTQQRVVWLANQACADFSCREGVLTEEQGQVQGQGAPDALLPPGVLHLLQQHMRVMVPQLLQLRRLQLRSLLAAAAAALVAALASMQKSGS
jgi:hypothetical protein